MPLFSFCFEPLLYLIEKGINCPIPSLIQMGPGVGPWCLGLGPASGKILRESIEWLMWTLLLMGWCRWSGDLGPPFSPLTHGHEMTPPPPTPQPQTPFPLHSLLPLLIYHTCWVYCTSAFTNQRNSQYFFLRNKNREYVYLYILWVWKTEKVEGKIGEIKIEGAFKYCIWFANYVAHFTRKVIYLSDQRQWYVTVYFILWYSWLMILLL